MRDLNFRHHVLPRDIDAVHGIVVSTGFFSAAEANVAVELVETHLERGEASGYLFVFAEDREGNTLGYGCFGPVPCTSRTFDLYWIVVHDAHRGAGLGRAILAEVEGRLARAGGGKLIAETSSRLQYLPTRRFYTCCGFVEEARIRDYYAPGEDVLYFTKSIG